MPICRCVLEKTNMILFAILAEELGVVESAQVTCSIIISMLIIAWGIYSVYTEW